MLRLESAWLHLHQFDELATLHTPIHHRHAGAKILVTFLLLLLTASFPPYAVSSMLPLLLYPLLLLRLGKLPLSPILKRLALALPFLLFLGLFNPLFDRTPLLVFGSWQLSGGWLSFFSLLLRSSLAVSAALLLLATSGLPALCGALLAWHVPRSLLVQFLLLHRYSYVLLEEMLRTLRAYQLRSNGNAALQRSVWGSLPGHLLLRSHQRAKRIYQAMLCRGFDGTLPLPSAAPFTWRDALYVIAWGTFFLFVRCYDLPHAVATLFLGGRL